MKGRREKHQDGCSRGQKMEWEPTLTLGSFSKYGWTYQDRQTEQLEAKLGAVENINYLTGAAIPLGREG